MSKAMRRKMVDELGRKTKGHANFVLFDYRGMTANQVGELRRDLRADQVKVTVVKNAIALHTLEKSGLAALKEHVIGMTAMAYGPDPVAIAKKLVAFREKTKKPEIRAAYVEGRVFKPEQVVELSKLPGRPEMLSMFLGLLQAPTQKFVGTLNEVIRKFLGTLQAVQDKLEGKPA